MKICPYCNYKFKKIDIIFNKYSNIKCPNCKHNLSPIKSYNNINYILSIFPIISYTFFTNQLNFYLTELTKNPKLSIVFFAFLAGLWGWFINGLSPLWSKYR